MYKSTCNFNKIPYSWNVGQQWVDQKLGIKAKVYKAANGDVVYAVYSLEPSHKRNNPDAFMFFLQPGGWSDETIKEVISREKAQMDEVW